MSSLKKITSLLAAGALAAGTVGAFPAFADEAKSPADMTTQEFVRDMGIGINLGNTFESCDTGRKYDTVERYETLWGSPVITEDMIKGYKEEGFGVLRIPVAWSNMMAEDYTIDKAYIDRVKEVTQWAVDADLYVIVNIHWDGGWLNNIPLNEEEGLKKYSSVWTQLSEAFKDFDEHLMFESLNEELGVWSDAGLWNQYSGTEGELKEKSYDLGNRINQTFVDIVRASGGNNANRHLLIAGFNTNIDLTSDPLFKMPTDPANRCALSLHYYDPFNYTHGSGKSWGSANDYKLLNDNMDKVKTNFIDKGIPVIMGECGYGSAISEKDPTSAHEYLTAVCDAMYSRGICPVLWDTPWSANEQDNVIYNRYEQKLTDTALKGDLEKVVANGYKEPASITATTEYDVLYGEGPIQLDAVSSSGADLQYSTSSSIISIDETGLVTITGTGNAVVTVYSPATDDSLAAFSRIDINISRNPVPPNAPETNMTVDDSVGSTDDIPLADGWSWSEKYDIPASGSVTAKAVYSDRNYTNRTVEVVISRAQTSPDTSSESGSSSTQSNASSSASSNTSSASSTGSSANTASSKAAAAATDNPATGTPAACTAAVAILFAAVMTVKKRNEK